MQLRLGDLFSKQSFAVTSKQIIFSENFENVFLVENQYDYFYRNKLSYRRRIVYELSIFQRIFNDFVFVCLLS